MTLLISVLKYTPVIGWIADLLTPVIGILGLPGECAVILVLGNLLNLYAAVGAIAAMQLTVKSVFILAVMLSFSHNLLVETSISTRIGVNPVFIACLRLGIAVSMALGINLVWSGGQEMAKFGLIVSSNQALSGWPEICIQAVKIAGLAVLQVAVIVIPIMVFIQVLKDINAIARLSGVLKPFTRAIGVDDKTGIPLMAGIMFGIAYGAGVIIQTAKEENLGKKDLYLATIFLVSCHAVVEDTLVFLPLGINVVYLLLIRIAFALIVTVFMSRLWKKGFASGRE
ncbi:nucleoside recognition domain protein [Syntrophobotulus glycolicus DSM 8271]|uniref:Nucleoside recognition domain protein n=1 Tax=Syntrophobotulus glycolicus (strain DSM 8271 / FlGlyR) TaxID=645991 RepID=F0T1I0_SYNGF|nr:nucleoside recognition domain protein [Syntrophobotulus glycolicus DSM 8271]